MTYTTFADAGIALTGEANSSGERHVECPQCSPTRKKKNMRSLRVNERNGRWKCYHPSCSWTGALEQPKSVFRPPLKKIFDRPDYTHGDLPKDVYDYLVNKRKLSPDALKQAGVGFNANKKAITFPYLKNGKVVNVRYRGQKKKIWQSTNAEQVLWGHDLICAEKPLVITEGELDRITMDTIFPEGEYINTSVPNGSQSFEFLENCEEKLALPTKIILAGDSDEPGQKMIDELARRLGKESCWRVRWPEDCNDANETLMKIGPLGVEEAIEGAEPWPIESIHEAVEYMDEVLRIKREGLKEGLDPGLGIGRCYRLQEDGGELHIMTGIPGHGKSTLLDQITLQMASNYGWHFGVWSPENKNPSRHIIKLVRKHLHPRKFEDASEEEVRHIVEYLNDRYSFIMPEAMPSVDDLLEASKALTLRRGIRGLVLDPWNRMEHMRPSNLSETEYCGQVLCKLSSFAVSYGVHVWLIAHPKKQNQNDQGEYLCPRPWDISGSSHFFNVADSCTATFRRPLHPDEPVEFHVQKIKEEGVNGTLGIVYLKFNRDTLSYETCDQKPEGCFQR